MYDALNRHTVYTCIYLLTLLKQTKMQKVFMQKLFLRILIIIITDQINSYLAFHNFASICFEGAYFLYSWRENYNNSFQSPRGSPFYRLNIFTSVPISQQQLIPLLSVQVIQHCHCIYSLSDPFSG